MEVLKDLLFDANNIASHPMTGNSYQLNEIGKNIINLLKQQKDLNEIIGILSEEYAIDRDLLFIDVSDFIAKLKIYELLV